MFELKSINFILTFCILVREDTSRPSKNEGSPRAAAQSDGDEQINSLLSALLGPSPGSTPLNEAVTVKWEAESPYFRSYSPVNSSSNANSNIDCPIVHYRKGISHGIHKAFT